MICNFLLWFPIQGALDNILKFSFWLYFIYQVKLIANLQIQKNWLLIYKYKKKYSKIPSEVKKSPIFVKHVQSGDEANLYSCCCLKYGYSKPKCCNFHNDQLIFVSVQRTAQTSFRTFLQTRIIMNGAKFNSHDSDGHF